jgi:hypothetical protein
MAGNIGIVASAFSSRSVSRGRLRVGKITVCTEGFSRDLAREGFPATWRGMLFPTPLHGNHFPGKSQDGRTSCQPFTGIFQGAAHDGTAINQEDENLFHF